MLKEEFPTPLPPLQELGASQPQFTSVYARLELVLKSHRMGFAVNDAGEVTDRHDENGAYIGTSLRLSVDDENSVLIDKTAGNDSTIFVVDVLEAGERSVMKVTRHTVFGRGTIEMSGLEDQTDKSTKDVLLDFLAKVANVEGQLSSSWTPNMETDESTGKDAKVISLNGLRNRRQK